LLCVGSSTQRVAAAKKSILNDFRTIDVVINAGVGYRSFVELAEDDEINKIVEVNGLVW
jgi:short-subunit dehydrogenase